MATKWTLEEVNSRLKAGKVGVVVVQREDRLSLRATFPPKPGIDKAKWHQKYLRLGVYANPGGFQTEEVEAKKIGECSLERNLIGGSTWMRSDRPKLKPHNIEWNLVESQVPICNGETFMALGSRVYQMFKRRKIPFNPYCL